MEVAAVIGIFVLVGGLLLAYYLKRRKMSFEGVVIDKDILEEAIDNTTPGTQGSGITIGGIGGGVRHIYKIKIKTTTGKEIDWQISEGKYQITNIGDMVSKAANTMDINITPKLNTTSLTPPASNGTPPTTQPPNVISN